MWMGLGARCSLVPLCAGKGQGVECWDLVSLGCELWDTFSWNLVPSELCEEWRERVIFGLGQHSSDGTGLAVIVSCQLSATMLGGRASQSGLCPIPRRCGSVPLQGRGVSAAVLGAPRLPLARDPHCRP